MTKLQILFNYQPPCAKVFPDMKLPKCISFLEMGDEISAVIGTVFGVVDIKSEVRISKFKLEDPIWRFRMEYFSDFWILLLYRRKNS